MLIGKTASSISIQELFQKYSEVQIFTAAFPEVTSIPCKISSPFRVDNNPSFSIYLDNDGHIKFKDFGDSACHGGLLDLLCKKWNCSFRQVFDKILQLMAHSEVSAEGFSPSVKSKQMKILTRKEASESTKIQVAVRPWQKYDYDYWASYGIEKQWLKYAEIYPISHKIVIKRDSGAKYIFGEYLLDIKNATVTATEISESTNGLTVSFEHGANNRNCDIKITSTSNISNFGELFICDAMTDQPLTYA